MFTCEIVSWTELKTQIRDIRTQVFIDEQGVAEDIEIDGLDALPNSLHILGKLGDEYIATGRLLESGKIGRISVLKAYRGQGYGAMLVRELLAHAINTNTFDRLYLHAQCNSEYFYQKLGFVSEGDVFFEADIEHRLMVFAQKNSDALEKIFQDRVIRLSSPTDFSSHIERQVRCAIRKVDILTFDLSHHIFNEQVAQALSFFTRSYRQAKARILIQNSKSLIGRNHPLVILAQRLPSSIDIRILTEKPEHADQGYVITDKKRLVFFNNERELEGFVNYRAPAESEHQLEIFEHLWQNQSKTDPELSRLSL